MDSVLIGFKYSWTTYIIQKQIDSFKQLLEN